MFGRIACGLRRGAGAAVLALALAAPAADATPKAATGVSVADVVRATGESALELRRASKLTPEQLARFVAGAHEVSGFSAADIGTILTERPELIRGIAVEESVTGCEPSNIDQCEIDENALLPRSTVGFVETNDPEVEDAAETPHLFGPEVAEAAYRNGIECCTFKFIGKSRGTLKSVLGSTIAYVELHVSWYIHVLNRRVMNPFVMHQKGDVTTGGYISGWRMEEAVHAPEPDMHFRWGGSASGGHRWWRRAEFKQTIPGLPDPRKAVNTKIYGHWNGTCTGCDAGLYIDY